MAGRTGRKPYDTAIGKAPQFKEEINTLRAEFIEIILQYLSGSTEKDDFYEMIAICLETRGSTSKVRKARARKSIEEYFQVQHKERATLYNDYRNISFNQTVGDRQNLVSDWLNVSDWNEWDR